MSKDERPANEEAPSITAQREGVDWLLAFLVNVADAGVEAPIIVAAEGALISGRLMSAHAYLDDVKTIFETAEGNSGSLPAALADGMSIFRKQLPPEGSLDLSNKPAFLHMKNARVIAGRLNIDCTHPWRCRLDRITGFTFGSIAD